MVTWSDEDKLNEVAKNRDDLVHLWPHVAMCPNREHKIQLGVNDEQRRRHTQEGQGKEVHPPDDWTKVISPFRQRK